MDKYEMFGVYVLSKINHPLPKSKAYILLPTLKFSHTFYTFYFNAITTKYTPLQNWIEFVLNVELLKEVITSFYK